MAAPWTQCRTRLALRSPGTGEPPWRVALEELQSDVWQPMREWAFAERGELDRSLAALGLRPEQVESLHREGAVELGT